MKFKPFNSYAMCPFHKKIQTILTNTDPSFKAFHFFRLFKLKGFDLLHTVGGPIQLQIKEKFDPHYEF